MAHPFRPQYTRPVPKKSEPCTYKGEKAVKWKGRKGNMVYGILIGDGTRCRVESGVHWIEFRNHKGKRDRQRGYRDLTATKAEAVQLARIHERIAAKILTVEVLSAEKCIQEHLADYKKFLASKKDGVETEHVLQTHSRIETILTATECYQNEDLTLERVSNWIAMQVADKMALGTANGYIRAIRGFSRWLSSKGMLSSNPLANLQLRNADEDPRVIRRTIESTEFFRLVEVTAKSKKIVRHMNGVTRSILYLVAGYSGLRVSELVELTGSSFHFGQDPSFVQISAKDAKNNKFARIPIPAGVASRIKGWIGDRDPSEPLWPSSWAERGHGAEVLRSDLEEAGIPEFVDGEVFDFHALRSYFVTSLVLAGVPLAEAQVLARHSSPALTAKHYLKLKLRDLGAQTDKLPDLES